MHPSWRPEYKRFLAACPLETRVELRGLGGEFQMDEAAPKPAVFLAGGIGIAPFRSMIRQAVHGRTGRAIYLFYSNRRPEAAAYLDELNQLASCHPNLHVVPTISGCNSSIPGWHGETGHLTPEMLRRHLPGGLKPLFSICGPSRFVAGIPSLTTAMDASEADLQLEDFGEY